MFDFFTNPWGILFTCLFLLLIALFAFLLAHEERDGR